MKMQSTAEVKLASLFCLLCIEISSGQTPSTIDTCVLCRHGMSHNRRHGTNEMRACHLLTLRHDIKTALNVTLEWESFRNTRIDGDMNVSYSEIDEKSTTSVDFESIDTFMVWMYRSLQNITLAISKIEHFEQNDHNSRVKRKIHSLLCDVQLVVIFGDYRSGRRFCTSDCIARNDTLSGSGVQDRNDVINFTTNTIAGTKFDLEFMIKTIKNILDI